MSISPEDELAISNLVDEQGWEATAYSLLRRASTAERELKALEAHNVRLRRDVDDLTAGWKPLAVRVMEGMMKDLGFALWALLGRLEDVTGREPEIEHARKTAKEFAKMFPKLAEWK